MAWEGSEDTVSTSFSLEQLSTYIIDNVERIGAVRKEVEEIQVGFNSTYVERKAEHDSTLERLTERVTNGLDGVGHDLQARVEKQLVEERGIIAERRQQLRGKLIPSTQAEADGILSQGQRLTRKLRNLNPQLDQREEKLKAKRATLEEDLAQFNDQIGRMSGCLGVVFNFRKINQLDRLRQRVIGKLGSVQQDLKEVREEWQATHHQIQDEQEDLQAQWQEATLKLAQLQGELDYLDDEASREALALKRAARNVIDTLKDPIPCPDEALRQELDSMVKLNVQTDDYQEGLGSVSSLMSVLDGITEGLQRLSESVEGLIKEQKMHSAYLPRLDISVPDEVLAFHEQWNDLRHRVRDDRRLCAHPAEFVAGVRPVVEGELGEADIKAMFESMGQALKRATRKWKG
jgi:chromosome segregation ATPase